MSDIAETLLEALRIEVSRPNSPSEWAQMKLERDLAREELAKERSIWCDKPEDRLYHAEDRTWWRRNEEGKCVRADPPDSEGLLND